MSSELFNCDTLPSQKQHPLYNGGLVRAHFRYGGQWIDSRVDNVSLSWPSDLYGQYCCIKYILKEGVIFVHCPEYVPPFVFYEPFDGKVYKHFWMCIQHSKFVDVPESPKRCASDALTGFCKCGAFHCSAVEYRCLLCNALVPSTAQLCGKTVCFSNVQ
jgi:hypothetical protein